MKIDWDQVVEDLGPRLYRYFCARFDQALADDLTQDTLVRLVQKQQQGLIDPERGSLRMFAFGIAHFVAMEARRAHPHSEPLPEHDTLASEAMGAEETLVRSQELQKLRQAIKTLPETERDILCLMIDQELKLEEIAGILQTPLNTVKSHIHRAKTRLAQLLSAEGVHA